MSGYRRPGAGTRPAGPAGTSPRGRTVVKSACYCMADPCNGTCPCVSLHASGVCDCCRHGHHDGRCARKDGGQD